MIYPKGSEAVLADNFEGKPFGRPNDLVVDKKGGVYFSEPGAAAESGESRRRRRRYRRPCITFRPAGKIIKVADGFRPNGIQLSRDEKTLYVNNTAGEYLLAFDIQPDGTLKNRRDFAKYEGVTRTESGVTSGADGLAIDNDGRIYIATPPGIQVFSQQGQAPRDHSAVPARRRTWRLPGPTRKRSISSGAATATGSRC